MGKKDPLFTEVDFDACTGCKRIVAIRVEQMGKDHKQFHYPSGWRMLSVQFTYRGRSPDRMPKRGSHLKWFCAECAENREKEQADRWARVQGVPP